MKRFLLLIIVGAFLFMQIFLVVSANTVHAIDSDQEEKLVYLEAFRNNNGTSGIKGRDSRTCRAYGQWRGNTDGVLGNGDLVDSGVTRGVVGKKYDNGAGVRNCAEVFRATMRYVAESIGVEQPGDDNEYQALYIYLAQNSLADAKQKYSRKPRNAFNGGTVRVSSDQETNFVRDYVDKIISEIPPPTAENIMSRLTPALNFCFVWGKTALPNDPAITDNINKVYARYKSFGSDTTSANPLDNLKDVLPEYKSDSGVVNAGNDSLRDINLEFEADTAGIGDGNWDMKDSQWFPFGSDIRKVMGNAYASDGSKVSSGAILDCRTVAKDLYPKIKDVLQVNNDGGVALKGTDPTIPSTSEGGELGAEGDEPSCEGGSMDWVVCPIVNGLANLSDAIVTRFLQPVLRVQILDLPNSSANDASSVALYGAWKGFRNIANILLIFALLAIIISTAFSSE